MATEEEIRETIIETCLALNHLGLNQGTSGNVSARHGHRLLISPSAVPYDQLRPDMIAALDLSGDPPKTWDGPLKPSTEWRFHWLTMTRRHDVTALIHAHPPYATALSILREPIPPCHYMIAAFGGMDVRVCDYATVGSSELAEYVLAGLDGRNACLMANHGIVATGLGLEQALWRTGELEAVARHYHLARQIGEPVLLKEEEIADTHRVFAGYGLRGTEDTRDPTGRGLI